MPAHSSAMRELGQFLKARRAELHPEDVGLVAVGDERRRVTGLRREEVAQLASISTGLLHLNRARTPACVAARPRRSDPRAATRTGPGRLPPHPARADRPTERISPGTARRASTQRAVRVARLLAQLDDTPALVFSHRLDILDWNDLAAALLLDPPGPTQLRASSVHRRGNARPLPRMGTGRADVRGRPSHERRRESRRPGALLARR